MPKDQASPRVTWWRPHLNVWWVTVAFFAILIAYADGFWVISMQGAVATFQHTDPPFDRWLRVSTLMLPLFVLAVLSALLIARRWVGTGHRGLVKYGTTALLLVVLTSGVAIGEVAGSTVYDYHTQNSGIAQREHIHATVVAPGSASLEQSGSGSCTEVCAIQRVGLRAHMRAAVSAALLVLITNLVLVLWVMALRSNRLLRRPSETAMNESTVVPEHWSVA